ncbi:MAG: ATP-binding protein, partial [Nitratireductor sp.]
MGGQKGDLIVEQAASMQEQVEHYLKRARIAAQRDSVVFRTPTRDIVERLVRVFRKLNPAVTVESRLPAEEIVFAGEREDLEEILGNLLENAVKWAESRVRVSLTAGADDRQSFEISIEDDGPGIPPDKAREALKRGRRLDESKPGTGLGLAIVADLVGEYGGTIALERGQLGGLRVAIVLRQAS